MKNPAASGRGIETDLLVGHAPHCNLKTSPQGDGEFTRPRLKKLDKKSMHLGGAIQFPFEIGGKRSDERPFYQQLFNESWVHALPSEIPQDFQKS